MSFPRYVEYKLSGSTWLGEIPGHWNAAPIKRSIRGIESETSVNALDAPADQDKIGVLKTSCVYTGQFDPNENKTVDDDDLNRVSCPLKAGTLVVSRMNTPDLIGAAGHVEYAPPNIYLPDRLWQVSFSNANVRFVYYWTLTDSYRSQVKSACTGTSSSMKNLSQEQFTGFAFSSPPVAEQGLIASFLDRETAKIDGLVSEQRRLIELLTEKRQAVISHAVTKGLNPHAPMKASGIDWLGNVPKHWESRRVKTVSTFLTSGPRGWSDLIADEGSIFVQSGDLNDTLKIDFENAKRVQVGNDAESSRTQLCEDDVVVCVTGAKTGNVAVCVSLPEPAFVNQHVCLIRPSSEVVPMFLGILLKSKVGQTYFEQSQYGLKQGLSLEDVKEAPVLLPPFDEQRQIVDFIHSETAKLDALTTEARRGIDLLRERRTSLISAAVTGKIDVRGLVRTEAA